MNLEQVQARIRELTKQLADDDTGSAALDARENADLDSIREEIAALRIIEGQLLLARELPRVPGTWNLDDTVKITYLKVISYGKERPTPEPVIATLTPTTNISKMDINSGSIEMPISTPLGAAILNRAGSYFRITTPVGYIEINVEHASKVGAGARES